MRVTLFMAMSVNGMIAREDGSEDFLSDTNWETFASLVMEYGNFVVGRKTYEVVAKWDQEYGFDDFVDVKKVIITHNSSFTAPKEYGVTSSPHEVIEILQEHGFENILLSGGSRTNRSFLDAGLISEIILNVEPVILGKGIPLFAPTGRERRLTLIKNEEIGKGIIQLRYRVSG